MTSDAGLPVLAWALAGCEPAPVPPGRRVELPEPGPGPKGARLGAVAEAMASRAALDLGGELPAAAGILFASAWGCLSEAEAFVEGAVRPGAAEPSAAHFARAFHDRIPEQLARALGARGPRSTFAHGEVAFAQALRAAQAQRAAGAKLLLVGGADESTPYVNWARAACQGMVTPAQHAEGGALLVVGSAPEASPLAVVERVALARPRSPKAWLGERLEERAVDVLLVALPKDRERRGFLPQPVRTAIYTGWTGTHPAAGACAVAIAVGFLTGEVPPAKLDRDDPPAAVGVVTPSRFGDLGLVVVRQP